MRAALFIGRGIAGLAAYIASRKGRDGAIWCGTSRGVYRFRESNGSVTFEDVDIGLPLEPGDASNVAALVEDRNGVQRNLDRGDSPPFALRFLLPIPAQRAAPSHAFLWPRRTALGLFRSALFGDALSRL